MNIVLIGYRGTGKSAVGTILADRLKMPCIGMDAEIVKLAGMSIPEIVETSGWPIFRDMESEVASQLSGRDNIIIDTGGGVIERPENIANLQKNGRIFWLKASEGTIVARIQDGTQRPALTDGKTFIHEVADVLAQRIARYQSAARYEIDTDAFTPEQVAERIIEIYNRKQT